MNRWSDSLERNQTTIYFAAVGAGAFYGLLGPGAHELRATVNPALALMLFATFLQVPVTRLGDALSRGRFLSALFVANFVAVPVLVLALLAMFPAEESMLRLGVLLVLLTPCVDYVVVFCQMGRGDARLLLAATPLLLIVQMLLLPVYLFMFLGGSAAGVVRPGPFVEAFLWLIALPLGVAWAVQLSAAKHAAVKRAVSALGVLPVPATAAVLFVVIASVLPEAGSALDAALGVVPIYVSFAVFAPFVGWLVARVFALDAAAARSVIFSAATRNSLVVLPLAYAVPGAVPMLPAVLVTQTLVELASELIYGRVLGRVRAAA